MRRQIPRPETAHNWPHLTPIVDQLMPYREGIRVGLLIGTNCMHAIKQMEVIPRKEEDLYARKSALGWGVIGIVNPTKNEEDDSHCSCHCIASLEVNLEFDERRRVLVGYTKEIDIDYIRKNLVPKPLELKQRMIKDADILLLQLFIERPAFLSIYYQAAD